MATFGEVIYSIRERLRQHSDDSDFDDLYILYELNIQRGLYHSNKKTIDDQAKQVICVELKKADSLECNCETTSCLFLKSKYKIPSFVEIQNKIALTNITSTSLDTIPFVYVPFSNFNFFGKGRFTKNSVYATIHPNGHLYIKSSNENYTFIEKVLVYGIFQNPLEALKFCSGEDCSEDFLNKEYPESPQAIAFISDIVTQIMINKMKVPRDTTNNSFEQ